MAIRKLQKFGYWAISILTIVDIAISTWIFITAILPNADLLFTNLAITTFRTLALIVVVRSILGPQWIELSLAGSALFICSAFSKLAIQHHELISKTLLGDSAVIFSSAHRWQNVVILILMSVAVIVGLLYYFRRRQT